MIANCRPYFGILICAVLLALLASCSSVRKSGIWLSEEEFRNYDASKEMAEVYLLIWPFQSGMIRSSGIVGFLPTDTIAAMDKLDTLAKKPSKEMTDQDWGSVLVLQARIKSKVAKEAFDFYFPGLFQVITSTTK